VIADLEKQKADEAEARKKAAAEKGPAEKLPIVASRNPVFQQLRVALAESEANVAALRARASELEARYQKLQASANKVPQVEAELKQLNRDYEVQKRNYESLLARRESAALSTQIDAATGLADFRIEVANGATLTIEPGVEVRYSGAYEILINGTISANGTTSSPIVFTSSTPGVTSGATMLRFAGANLSQSVLNNVKMEHAAYAVRVGMESEHNQAPVKNSGTLTVSNVQIKAADILTNGYGTTANLVISGGTIDNATVKGAYPRSEPIEIANAIISNSTINSDSYNYGITVRNSTVTNSNFTIGCCGANLHIIGSLVRDSHFSDYNNYYDVVIENSKFINTPLELSTANSVTISNSVINNSVSSVIRVKGLTMTGSSVIGSGNSIGIETFGGSCSISKSTIVENSVGIKISGSGGSLAVSNSNLYRNGTYNIENRTGGNITAMQNYWGTTRAASAA
jgi:FKBP-type peptidyl-prolyl cis-trans isomerase